MFILLTCGIIYTLSTRRIPYILPFADPDRRPNHIFPLLTNRDVKRVVRTLIVLTDVTIIANVISLCEVNVSWNYLVIWKISTDSYNEK